MYNVFAFSILVPTLIGIVRFNSIHKSYRLFIYFLLVTALSSFNYELNDTLHAKHLVSHLLEVLALFFMFTLLLRWNNNKLSFKVKCLLKAALIILLCYGIYAVSGNVHATNWPQLIVLTALSAYAFGILMQQKNTQRTNVKAVPRKLIIFPFIISSIYFITIKIALYFLYTPANESFFIELYSILVIINLLSYICYSLALQWAPKKEKYL
jgi:hypothetical protein